MPYITREDGEHFVIPSYRDVIMAKQANQIKKEILLLSKNYGEFITLHKKNAQQYEVAFSPDIGYLLGESIWHYFKHPNDFIYCEAIPNAGEAILVIVKSGSVYLDGSFSLDSIADELVIFLTQQNNFEIYINGDVPISAEAEEGKFSFEPSSVKSFTVLDKPVFASLPLYKQYQLQLVDQVLKAAGIGVFPLGKIAAILLIAGLGWFGWRMLTAPEKKEVPSILPRVNPYLAFMNELTSPAPKDILLALMKRALQLATIPGWSLASFEYASGKATAKMISLGGSVQELFAWASWNNIDATINDQGVRLDLDLSIPPRPTPRQIYSLKTVMARLIDDVSQVYPGNNIKIDASRDLGNYSTTPLELEFNGSPFLLELVSEKIADLPLVLESAKLTVSNDGAISGKIDLTAVGD